MANVYIWPRYITGSLKYSDQSRVRREVAINGAPSLAVEIEPRVTIEVGGTIARDRRPDLDIFLDRMGGGTAYAGLWDMDRVRFGWDGVPALRTSDGAEFWHVTGRTSLYNDDAADGTTWRSIFALANGAASAGATSLAVDGLLPGEVIPRGSFIRIGDFRHTITASVTANGSGEATLSLARPLRANVADNAGVRIPGDFCVCQLFGPPDIDAKDSDGVGDFKLTFLEVYAGEVVGGFTYVVD